MTSIDEHNSSKRLFSTNLNSLTFTLMTSDKHFIYVILIRKNNQSISIKCLLYLIRNSSPHIFDQQIALSSVNYVLKFKPNHVMSPFIESASEITQGINGIIQRQWLENTWIQRQVDPEVEKQRQDLYQIILTSTSLTKTIIIIIIQMWNNFKWTTHE